ncbi:MAG: A/G-specific adenine glycosylase [Desulfobacterales bacterium]
MTPNEIAIFHHRLLSWFHDNQRALPWRKTRDPFPIWVSEVMLQQTQVQTVIPYYLRFMDRFPTVSALASADIQTVLKLWEGLGYYSRARHLHRACRGLMESTRGRIPENVHDFRTLPGVGPYIANAVMSMAFGHPLAVVDGNVKRVLSRILLKTWPVNHQSTHGAYQAVADDLLHLNDPGNYNQAIMELGALICRPRYPNCRACPVREHCRAFQEKVTASIPTRIKRKPVPEIPMMSAVIWRRKQLLLIQRPDRGLLGGLWEFPGETLHGPCDAEDERRRLIRDLTGLAVRRMVCLGTVRHAYTHFRVRTEIVVCSAPKGKVTPRSGTAFRWLPLESADELPLPRVQQKILARLRASSGALHIGR